VTRGLIALLVLTSASALPAREWRIAEGSAQSLESVLERVADGDRVRVAGGVHRGPFLVRRSIELLGEGWPVLDGGGRGTVVSLLAPGTRLEGFVIRGSGTSLDEESSGVVVEAPSAVVRGNRLEEVLFGIYLREAEGGIIEGNVIRGMDLDLPRRGDAIRVWYSDGVLIRANEVSDARDVVLWYSSDLVIVDNSVSGGRYGLHFMYCDDASIQGNRLVDNSVGAFLMYSRRLRLLDNLVSGNHGPSGYGVGLKDMDDAVVRGNLFLANRVGAYLDNSPRDAASTSVLGGNVFGANQIGVLLMPNVRRASVEGNDFLENEEQVAFAGEGTDPHANLWRGNHWSDYAGYDADGDGVGEIPYRAEKLYERVSDRTPALRVFVGSPATIALDFAAEAFPVVKPRPKLVDRMPHLRGVAAAGVPRPEAHPASGSWAFTGGLLALAALGIVALPRLGRLAGARVRAGALSGTGRSTELSARGLSVVLGGHEILRDLSFTVEAGESVALWGSNGAGKTTALRALLGLVPFSGTVAIDGLDIRLHGRTVRSRVGFVPQEVTLQPDLSVRETFSFYAGLRRVAATEVGARAEWLGLTEHLDKKVQELSGGLKQRLALGLALLGDPPVLLLDEPTASLDAAGRERFYRLLDELHDRGKTLVFTSHRAEEVARLADRVLRLEDGRLQRIDSAGERGGCVPVDLAVTVDGEAMALRLGAVGVAARWDGGTLWIEGDGRAAAGAGESDRG
jgi:nitrous oxidase accessory protein